MRIEDLPVIEHHEFTGADPNLSDGWSASSFSCYHLKAILPGVALLVCCKVAESGRLEAI